MAWRQRILGGRARLAVALLLAVGVAAVSLGGGSLGRGVAPSPSTSSPEPGAGEHRALADAVAQVLAGDSNDPRPLSGLSAWLPDDARGSVYVALRSGGERVSEAWFDADTPDEALRGALAEATAAIDPDERAGVDIVEAAVAGHVVGERDVEGSVADNIDRGVLGIDIGLGNGERIRLSPTRMIATNTSFDRTIEQAREDGFLPARATLFEATQLLVDLDRRDVHLLYRGSEVVPAGSVSPGAVEALATGMADWLFAQLGVDGRLVYEYYPSRGEESSSNNMIRQWMATVAMTRVALQRGDEGLIERVARNIDYNLSISYEEEGGDGLIADPDGEVKLGAIALAALAIREHPERGRWRDEEAALLRAVDELWQPDGSFRTFYRPAERNDNQNFYPGEALLLWATALEDDPGDESLRERFMASFRHYRDWHREQPNPAFVPWHTMAYEKVWRQTGEPELRDFIFEMNDWLLQMQQWDDAPSPDTAGRFYDPDRPDYGPPHASSDGVYLEGLIAAHRVARATGDEDRAERYRIAVARGLRHLMQLQFADPIDMYYVSQPDRVAGGLRTTVYDNRIRVDNVQHGLMAALDVIGSFGAEDYRIEEP